MEEKKRAYEEWMQHDSLENYEIYREKNREVKRKVKEEKRLANIRWGQELVGRMRNIKRSSGKKLRE